MCGCLSCLGGHQFLIPTSNHRVDTAKGHILVVTKPQVLSSTHRVGHMAWLCLGGHQSSPQPTGWTLGYRSCPGGHQPLVPVPTHMATASHGWSYPGGRRSDFSSHLPPAPTHNNKLMTVGRRSHLGGHHPTAATPSPWGNRIGHWSHLGGHRMGVGGHGIPLGAGLTLKLKTNFPPL